MSGQRVEAVKRYYELSNAGDYAAAFEVFDDDVLIDFSRRLIEPGVVRGRSAAEGQAAKVREAWDSITVTPERFHDGGNHVVVELTSRGRGVHSGVETVARTAELWTFDGDKVVHWTYFGSDLESALEAAGIGS